MRKRIVIVNGVLVFFSVLMLFIFSLILINSNSKQSSYKQIEDYSELLENYFDGSNVTQTINYFKLLEDLRVTIFDSNFNFLEDTKVDFDDGDIRPELKDLNVIYTRYSSNLNSDMLYLAIEDDGYYLRVSVEVSTVDSFIVTYMQVGTVILLIILSISVALSLILLNRTMTPINNVVKKLGDLCGNNTTIFNEDVLHKQIDFIQEQIHTKIIDLEKEKSKVEGIIQASIEGIIVIDKNENIILMNEKGFNIFGLNSNVLNNSYFSLLKSSEIIENITKCLKSKINVKFISKIDNLVYNINIINLDNQFIDGLMITLSDITVEYNLSQVKKDFFQNASHELKSPLTSILGYQQLIKEGIYETKEDVIDGVNCTIKQANKMNKLIIDMLELSQLESEYKEEVTSINLKLVVIEILDSFKLNIKEKNLNVILDLKDTIKEINGKHATQLLKNLIENAIKYNNDNSDLIISLDEKRFHVRDNGIGIERKNIDRIFERFYRVSSNNQIKGNGLGLAIVKHITNIYGYEIIVDSVLSRYTEINIIF